MKEAPVAHYSHQRRGVRGEWSVNGCHLSVPVLSNTAFGAAIINIQLQSTLGVCHRGVCVLAYRVCVCVYSLCASLLICIL